MYRELDGFWVGRYRVAWLLSKQEERGDGRRLCCCTCVCVWSVISTKTSPYRRKPFLPQIPLGNPKPCQTTETNVSLFLYFFSFLLSFLCLLLVTFLLFVSECNDGRLFSFFLSFVCSSLSLTSFVRMMDLHSEKDAPSPVRRVATCSSITCHKSLVTPSWCKCSYPSAT